MTAQQSEHFTTEYTALNLGEWHVFGIIRGEPTKENRGWGEGPAFKSEPGEAPTVKTSNWKGYTCHFHLRRDGRMNLDFFEYDDRSLLPRIVDELIEGDFYLVLKSDFFGPRLYIPFRGGTIQSDRTLWLHEDYIGDSPTSTELRPGCHPDFPRKARLWHQ